MGIFLAAIVLLVVAIMHMGAGGDGQYDKIRNLTYSHKGTYGTAGFLNPKEAGQVLDFVPDLRKHHGTILGEVDGRVVCIPEKTRFNGNLAVYGASGSKKTRAFCVNMILQCAARKNSLVICDPKSELYEKTSAYLRDQGYTVRVFNLVTPASSDSWNCLSEIDGQELMAQLFCDVIIRNTGSDRGDHFWDSAEMNLLKALVLFVERSYPPERRNIGEAYQLLVSCSEKELNELFDALPLGHPARAPYSIFRQSSESVRGGVIIGLGSRLQVFQNADIRAITSHDEIDLELPGKQPCAYYCITSDQDSTFDFLSSLFLSFIFIKLVRYADQNCPGGCLPVPVHVLGEELCACGVIPDLSRKISVIRSRNISMSCVFQNLAGLQNRYPNNQWQEILGNCDVQLFLGCTDALTAEFISSRSGEASVAVTSQAKQLGTWRISNYTPEYRETSGVGRRRLLTMDEVLRLDVDKALVILNEHLMRYTASKESEGKTFPDYIGALMADELDHCIQLSKIYRSLKQQENEVRQAQIAEQDRVYQQSVNTEKEKAVGAALQIIRSGGTLKNDTLCYYKDDGSFVETSLILYLMREYHIDVPLRTQGWIKERLASATVQEDFCGSVTYYRAKKSPCSQKFFDCMRDLILAVHNAKKDAA